MLHENCRKDIAMAAKDAERRSEECKLQAKRQEVSMLNEWLGSAYQMPPKDSFGTRYMAGVGKTSWHILRVADLDSFLSRSWYPLPAL